MNERLETLDDFMLITAGDLFLRGELLFRVDFVLNLRNCLESTWAEFEWICNGPCKDLNMRDGYHVVYGLITPALDDEIIGLSEVFGESTIANLVRDGYTIGRLFRRDVFISFN